MLRLDKGILKLFTWCFEDPSKNNAKLKEIRWEAFIVKTSMRLMAETKLGTNLYLYPKQINKAKFGIANMT